MIGGVKLKDLKVMPDERGLLMEMWTAAAGVTMPEWQGALGRFLEEVGPRLTESPLQFRISVKMRAVRGYGNLTAEAVSGTERAATQGLA